MTILWCRKTRHHSRGDIQEAPQKTLLAACKFSLSFPWVPQPRKAPDVPQNLCQHSKNNINVKCWVKSHPGSIELNAGGCEVGRTRFYSFRISHKPTQSSDIWNPAFIPDLPPTISQQCLKQWFCLLPTPSLVFYSFLCSRSWGKSLPQLHPGSFTLHKREAKRTSTCGWRRVSPPAWNCCFMNSGRCNYISECQR